MDLEQHAEEVRELWDAFRRGANRRVPVSFAADESLWLTIVPRSFSDFYRDPAVQLEVQLEGKRRMVPGTAARRVSVAD